MPQRIYSPVHYDEYFRQDLIAVLKEIRDLLKEFKPAEPVAEAPQEDVAQEPEEVSQPKRRGRRKAEPES
jgi:hypothetical protein